MEYGTDFIKMIKPPGKKLINKFKKPHLNCLKIDLWMFIENNINNTIPNKTEKITIN